MFIHPIRIFCAIAIIALAASTCQAQAGVTWSTSITQPITGAFIGGAGGNAAMYGLFKWSSTQTPNQPLNWPNQVVVRVTDSNGNFTDNTGTVGQRTGGQLGGQVDWSCSAAIPNNAPSGGVATIAVTGNLVNAGPPVTTTQITTGSTTGKT